MPEFLDIELYKTSADVSTVVVQSSFLAAFISIFTAIVSYRAALHKKSETLFWLGTFSLFYFVWDVLYLLSYTQRDLNLSAATLTAATAHRGHLMVGLILPLLAHKFMGLIFFERQNISRLLFFTLLGVTAFFILPIERYYGLANLSVGIFIVLAMTSLCIRLFRVYQKTENLKLKTRAYFVVVGIVVCGFFSLVGQIRAEFAEGLFFLPYIGNILTAVFLYFLYQMVRTPRLREVRELMLRGIRVVLMTFILSVIFLSLLAWVGKDDPELFVFNTFVASFFILSVFEPVREKLDLFFLKQFIVERFEFEELLKKLQRKVRSARTLNDLTQLLLEGIRESGRIYQSGLYLWDQNGREFRLLEQSTLNFRTVLPLDHPFIQFFRDHQRPLLMEQEQDQDLSKEIIEQLKEMHVHLALPLFRQDELLGVWTLRTSFRSTNPYTSFSNPEIVLTELLAQDAVNTLDQLQHFESQERQKKLAALGEMSAALAHEIRNPLGAIHGACQLLETSPSLIHAEDRECIGILRKEVDRMQKTVNQYLSFARSAEDPIEIAVDTLIRKAVQDVQSKADRTNTRLIVEVPDGNLSIKTDPLKVEQVLTNLIQNACEAFSRNVWISASTVQSNVQISVRDDGPGIPPTILANMFVPLFTTKNAGSGLGLPICKKIIDSLGGTISVESKLNEGTTFKIVLPLHGEKEGRLTSS